MKEISIIMVYLVMSTYWIQAQDLLTQVAECYERIVDDDDLTLTININMYNRDGGEAPIDLSQIIMIRDKKGAFTEMGNTQILETDAEAWQIDKLGKTIIYQTTDQKISVIDQLKMPGLDSMINVTYNVGVEKRGKNTTYQLEHKTTCSPALTITIDHKRDELVQVIQYFDQPMQIDTSYITPILKTSYSYASASPRINIDQVASIVRDSIVLKPAYQNYELIQHKPIDFNQIRQEHE